MARTRSHGVSSDAPYAPAAFSARRDANAQTFTNAAFTKGTYDIEEYDVGGCFDHTTGVFTAQRSKLHLFMGSLAVTGLDLGERAVIGVYKNDAIYRLGSTSFSSAADQDIACNIAVLMFLAAGETADLRINQEEGADRLQSLVTGYNWFAGLELSA